MKRWIIRTLVSIFIALGVFFFIGFLILIQTDEEDCNDYPCVISSDNLFSKFYSVYNISSFSSYPKNYCCDCSEYNPALVKCNIIYLELGFNKPELDITQDSTALELAKFFWNNSLYSNVDSLYLELKQECVITYGISKNDLDKKYRNHKLEDFNDVPKYKVLYENSGTEYGGYYEASVFDVRVLVNHDYKNLDSLSLIIKNRYRAMLKDKKTDLLHLAIEIDEPYCELCLNQKYQYYFELTTKRRDSSKKHFKSLIL